MLTKQHTRPTRPAYVVCVSSGDHRVDLLVGKVYRTAKPDRNDRREDIRVIDESGEDYLYPAKWFVPVELPAKARRALAAIAVA